LDTFRPSNPIPFLSNYMLKNKESVKDLNQFLEAKSKIVEAKDENVLIDNYDEKGNKIIDEN
jgi:hypothetical protein